MSYADYLAGRTLADLERLDLGYQERITNGERLTKAEQAEWRAVVDEWLTRKFGGQ